MTKRESAGRTDGGRGAAVSDPFDAIARLERRLAAARRRIAALEAHADTDMLTGILNRRGFVRELRRSLAYARRYGATAALVYFDVDELKPVNDRHGHAAGDAALRHVARALAALVRVSDVIGRLGGDEFAVLMWNVSAQDARAKATQIERAIAAVAVACRAGPVVVGASAGVTLCGGDDEVEAVLDRADQAMYARKRARRDAAASSGSMMAHRAAESG
ncbi:MAG: GGDEF domain-containing protein [Xanthobacteraceae bacterium]|nr:MAG: GGDEF domain-containing protein [Xanthobacteraceae bacterium]